VEEGGEEEKRFRLIIEKLKLFCWFYTELIRAVTRQRIICHGRGIFTPEEKIYPGKAFAALFVGGQELF